MEINQEAVKMVHLKALLRNPMRQSVKVQAVNGTFDGPNYTAIHITVNKQKSKASRLFLKEKPSQMS